MVPNHAKQHIYIYSFLDFHKYCHKMKLDLLNALETKNVKKCFRMKLFLKCNRSFKNYLKKRTLFHCRLVSIRNFIENALYQGKFKRIFAAF